MFGSENSIEPVRGELPVTAARGTNRPATRTAADEPPIREMTPTELASAARRQRGTVEPDPIGAAPEARRGFFRRRPVEAPKLDAVAQRHGLYIAEKRGTRTYYADYQQKREVMRADGGRISTKLDDKQAVTAVLDLAEARGDGRREGTDERARRLRRLDEADREVEGADDVAHEIAPGPTRCGCSVTSRVLSVRETRSVTNSAGRAIATARSMWS